ncbi:MAG: DUF4190 domain-containing protein [Actinobacteria bacterium]|nr:DUF4190 domain-containing protein [Actinomycetota bacterium]
MATGGPPPPDLRPLRVGEILDVGIKVYTRHAKTLFKLVALVVIPVQILGILIILSTIPDALATGNQNPFQFSPDPAAPPEFDGGEFLVYMAGILVVVVLGFVSTAIATASCFKAVTDAYLGGTPQWRSSLRFTMDHFGPLMWVTLLATLGTLGGALLCILPGIWLGIVWSAVTPVLLTEGKRGTKALGRSFELVQSRFWPACGVIVISYLIEMVLNSAITGGVMLIAFTDVGQNVFLSQVLSGAAGAIAAIVATPFRAAVIAVLYFDLRVRKEGFDLQLLAQRIGSPNPDAARPALLPPSVPTPPVYPPSSLPPGAPPPPTYSAPPVNGLAIASLIASIFVCLGSIPGVIMGHLALGKINASQGSVGGRGVAIAGIIIGWIGVVLLALIVLGAIVSS